MYKFMTRFARLGLFAALSLGTSMLAHADIVLTFEGVGDAIAIENYYNGGAGGNLGVAFGSNALSVIDSDAGGIGNIANEPSANTVMFFLSGSNAYMNVASGFTNGFSFFYSSASAASVNVYDGLDGTGNVLATLNLANQYNLNCSGDPNGQFCNWTPVGVTFTGTAKSVGFGGTANYVAFDDITIGNAVPGNPVMVPEPSAIAIAGFGFALACFGSKRRKA